MKMKIIIGADMVPTESNYNKFNSTGVKDLVGDELLELLKSADYRIFNLETPLTDNGEKIEKCGASIKAPTKTIKGIKALGADLLCLSNNHIMDYGETGLYDTINLLNEYQIAYVGADIESSWSSGTYIIRHNEVRIGIYNCCEHEFSISNSNGAGSNPLQIADSFEEVIKLRKQVDSVIVLFHGGKEYYRFPSPEIQKICRKFVESGADLVITQHSHCIGTVEDYLSKKIIYGQGNFIFDAGNDEYWNSGMLVEIMYDKNNDEKISFSIKYHVIVKNKECIALADKKESINILQNFYNRNEMICNTDVLQKHYSEFAKNMLDSYLMVFRGYNNNILVRIINKILRGRFNNWLVHRIKKKDILRFLNYIECESHRELIIRGLRDRIKEK